MKTRSSAIVRVLLSLYLNKKLEHLRVDELVDNEIGSAKKAEALTLQRFRDKLIIQKDQKRGI
jgi:hypothetical protein